MPTESANEFLCIFSLQPKYMNSNIFLWAINLWLPSLFETPCSNCASDTIYVVSFACSNHRAQNCATDNMHVISCSHSNSLAQKCLLDTLFAHFLRILFHSQAIVEICILLPLLSIGSNVDIHVTPRQLDTICP